MNHSPKRGSADRFTFGHVRLSLLPQIRGEKSSRFLKAVCSRLLRPCELTTCTAFPLAYNYGVEIFLLVFMVIGLVAALVDVKRFIERIDP